MKTYLDCIPCFYRQLIDASRRAGLSDKKIKEIIDESGEKIRHLDLECTPPEVAGMFNRLIKNVSGKKDIYRSEKARSNGLACGVYDICREKVDASDDPLLTAIEFSIAGNIIDYGVSSFVDVKREIENMSGKGNSLMQKHRGESFSYKEFSSALAHAENILFLADNAGEILFDRILIETIKSLRPEIHITIAVRGEPIINDALVEDAMSCGLDTCAEIISSGSDMPGTVLSLCDSAFMEYHDRSDMIISKGQGNYESFESPWKDVFYLFMAKCPVVARHARCAIREINLIFLPGEKYAE
jgi:uncharacterized protein with ATP-grasp and redox domains